MVILYKQSRSEAIGLFTLLWLIMTMINQTSSLVDEHITNNPQISTFLKEMENLVLNTTHRALIITKNVYVQIATTMSTPLKQLTNPIIQEYIQNVDKTIRETNSYKEKRQLFAQFKRNNLQIERIKKENLSNLQNDELKPFDYQLISNEFYLNGKNSTQFDNLYLDFIQQFQQISQKLWSMLSERTVEESQELLEILDEISNEQKLQEKDKLYDEFIEMFLFKENDVNEKSIL